MYCAWPTSTWCTPGGRFLRVGSARILLSAVPSSTSLRSATEREAARLVVAADARRPLAEADVGDRLERHGGAGGGGHRQVLERREVAARDPHARLTRIGICRSARENLALFCAMSPSVAMRMVSLMARDRDAQLRGQVEVRMDQESPGAPCRRRCADRADPCSVRISSTALRALASTSCGLLPMT